MDCGVRGLGFKSPGSILTSRTETSSLYISRVVRDGGDPCFVPLSVWKKFPEVESSTWLLNSHNSVEQPQQCWTATTVQKTTLKLKKTICNRSLIIKSYYAHEIVLSDYAHSVSRNKRNALSLKPFVFNDLYLGTPGRRNFGCHSTSSYSAPEYKCRRRHSTVLLISRRKC